MRFLDNLKIVTKVGLIVAVLGLVIVGASVELVRMTELAGAFTDIVGKERLPAALAVRPCGRRYRRGISRSRSI